MGLSLEEVRRREKASKRKKKKIKQKLNKLDVLQQWYFNLGRALEKSGSEVPDFSFELFADCYWFSRHEQAFIESIIGDQLEEYGLELTTLPILGSWEPVIWVCIGVPGQFDEYAHLRL